ncbi:hypothetical protein EYF80_029615 [Liparis tanakae]|uniref:Uncharacterized protein n=1 Tax=Liparis tanakae TaxID=230148 RepID=A0A4Z2H5I3_9TELE|nr:hypothetical protein EYF80_029615 [Liparis tanakae]
MYLNLPIRIINKSAKSAQRRRRGVACGAATRANHTGTSEACADGERGQAGPDRHQKHNSPPLRNVRGCPSNGVQNERLALKAHREKKRGRWRDSKEE